MSIELLWIVPIVAAALFVLIVALNFQKSGHNAVNGERDLNREVEEFNNRVGIDKEILQNLTSTRTNGIEKTVQLVSSALSNQQKIIEKFLGKDAALEHELNELKGRLHELQQEYDITLSENYSLKARLKKIIYDKNGSEYIHDTRGRSKFLDIGDGKLSMRNFSEHHPSRPSDLDDTSEINLSDFN